MNRRADQHARNVGARRTHGSDHAEWQADDRTGNLDRRRDDGGGAVESVGSGGYRLAIGVLSHRYIAGVDRMMGPVHNSVVDIRILLGRSRRRAIGPGKKRHAYDSCTSFDMWFCIPIGSINIYR